VALPDLFRYFPFFMDELGLNFSRGWNPIPHFCNDPPGAPTPPSSWFQVRVSPPNAKYLSPKASLFFFPLFSLNVEPTLPHRTAPLFVTASPPLLAVLLCSRRAPSNRYLFPLAPKYPFLEDESPFVLLAPLRDDPVLPLYPLTLAESLSDKKPIAWEICHSFAASLC